MTQHSDQTFVILKLSKDAKRRKENLSQELVASLLKEFGTVQKVILDTQASGRKALVKFAYKDSATRAVKHA